MARKPVEELSERTLRHLFRVLNRPGLSAEDIERRDQVVRRLDEIDREKHPPKPVPPHWYAGHDLDW